jgi:RNA polymerase sigma factor (sigma-70 family)
MAGPDRKRQMRDKKSSRRTMILTDCSAWNAKRHLTPVLSPTEAERELISCRSRIPRGSRFARPISLRLIVWLVAGTGLGHAVRVNPPDLRALQTGNADAWDEAFRWLWPAVFAVAQLKLQPFLPGEIEDTAIEALEELVEKVREVKAVEELKPLAASIAHHRAVSLLRERFAKKRGAGKTESLDAPAADGETKPEPASSGSPLDSLEQKELAERLQNSLTTLKPPMGDILSDFFLHDLRYEEIAQKRGIAVGSVGVYLKRGLEALRRIWGGRGNS